jgi:hypothetical protein
MARNASYVNGLVVPLSCRHVWQLNDNSLQGRAQAEPTPPLLAMLSICMKQSQSLVFGGYADSLRLQRCS